MPPTLRLSFARDGRSGTARAGQEPRASSARCAGEDVQVCFEEEIER
jgi:hypothetical protein